MSETRCHIEFARSARDDLRDILDWHESQEVPEVGTRMVLEIVARVRQLGVFPDSGKVVPELDTPWLRELGQPPFRIVYRWDETVVTVVRVWRSERLMDSGLARNA
jgi:toxin ParE1/3/4